MKIKPVLTVLLAVFATQSSAEFLETLPDGSQPTEVSGTSTGERRFSGAARQPSGSLAGRVIFTNGGHGWTWGKEGWYTQRKPYLEMNEDYGNLDQMNAFVAYAFNSGATVVAFRPVGHQTNEVVLDNISPGVSFSGNWFDSRSEIYFGQAGETPYRFAPLSATETATARYTPRIPVEGYYPVYTWVRHGADRTSQLYRILHAGGMTLVRVPHHKVGNGWVYLGTYYFDAGSHPERGAVVVSNLQPNPGFGRVAVADAIRFGNGMGDIVPAPGATVSTYPREEEASRYWVAKSLGHGQPSSLYDGSGDDQSDNVGTPPRMAREMNREAEGNLYQRIFVSFHSNAGGGRGTIGLWNNPAKFPGTMTPHQERLAELVGREINETFTGPAAAMLETPWHNRTRLTYARDDYAFGEINNKVIGDEFDATILEVAFHDSQEDALLLRDPKVRDLSARATYRAVVRYMNEFDKVPLRFLPEPPKNVRATASDQGIEVAWDAPESADDNAPQGYIVYRSENGYGFGHPVRVAGKNNLSLTLSWLPADRDFYFRVSAVNAAGESLVSETVGCRRSLSPAAPRLLFVNAFTQLDRLNNPRQTIARTNYHPFGPFGEMDRVIPRRNNAFDYVVQHGRALALNEMPFDSCRSDAVVSGAVALADYQAVFWSLGNEQKTVFPAAEQRLIRDFQKAGGHLFVSGSHVASVLDKSAKAFLSQQLHAALDATVTNLVEGRAVVASPHSALGPFDNAVAAKADGEIYFVRQLETLKPASGASAALHYADGGVAAVKYDGGADLGRTMVFSFPFETLFPAASRAEMMRSVLRYFGVAEVAMVTPTLRRDGESLTLSWPALPGKQYLVQHKASMDQGIWSAYGQPRVSPSELMSLAVSDSGFYRVLQLD